MKPAMEALAHVTEVEVPLGLVLFVLGAVVGFAVAFAIWGRSSNRND